MVIIHLSGGFGNQLFSYAFGYAVAKERNDLLYIDTAIQDAEWFFRNPEILKLNIDYDGRISYRISSKIYEKGLANKLYFKKSIGCLTKEIKESDLQIYEVWSNDFIIKINKNKKIYLRGNWASEKYFKPVIEDIKLKYIFKDKLCKAAEMIYDEICRTKNSVTVHYRRGDYVKLGASPTPEYFISAMKYISDRVENPVFFYFSEDLDWVKEQFSNLPYDIRYPKYSSENIDTDDFRLLGAGKHQIISNSTYSWWAAYLNSQVDIVIIPYKADSWLSNLVLDQWVKLPYKTT